MPNVCRGQLAVKWFETRNERKKEAPQEALTRPGSSTPKYTSRDVWTPQQDGLIRKVYPSSGSQYLMERLGKTENAIQSRARFLGVTFVDGA